MVFRVCKFVIRVKWGVKGDGEADVVDPGANPFPLGKGMPAASTEAQKKAKAKADLTPDASGRAPRTAYWSEALTVKHETFHMDDWESNYAIPKLGEAETWIEAQTADVTVTSLSPTGALNAKKAAFDTKVTDKAVEANFLYFPPREDRAYADGKAEYQNLANAIIP